MKGCYHQRDRESLDHSKNPVGTFKTSREIQIFVKSWSTPGRIIAINIQPTATIRHEGADFLQRRYSAGTAALDLRRKAIAGRRIKR
jgi:hypothetical protein